jgi:hypothetical protein
MEPLIAVLVVFLFRSTGNRKQEAGSRSSDVEA